MSSKLIRGTQMVTVSALALAVAGQAAAVSFDAGDTKVTIGGYVKADMIYDSGVNLGNDFGFRSINTGTTPVAEGHFHAHARQTRLSISTSTPTEDGPIKTLIQGDFFGAGGNEAVSNSYGFRIRHGWATWNGIGVGQTWSNFMPLVALAPTLDFGGPAGYIFNRQAQARYTTGGLSLALESSESRIDGTTTDKDALPDITARYTGKAGNLKYSASGVVTFLGVDDGTNDDSATGYGVMFAASTKTDGGLKLGGNVGHFDGANRYLWQGGGGTWNNAYVDGSGKIKTAGETAAMAFVDIPVSSQTQAGLTVGYAKLASEGTNITGAAEEFTTIHANLRYKPIKQVMLGVELMRGTRKEFSGADGDATRIQFSGQISF